MPLAPRWMPLPLSWKIVSRIRYPEWVGLVYMPGGLSCAPGAPRMVNPSQVMSSASSWTRPGTILPATPAMIDSRPRPWRVASRPAFAPLMVRSGSPTVTTSS